LLPRLFNEFSFPGWALEHAAVLETSVMMYLMPELVHEDKFLEEGLESSPTYDSFPPTPDMLPASGTLHTPRSSSVEKGRLIMENVVDNLEQIIKKEFR
jgi:creatinine amidohydrolase